MRIIRIDGNSSLWDYRVREKVGTETLAEQPAAKAAEDIRQDVLKTNDSKRIFQEDKHLKNQSPQEIASGYMTGSGFDFIGRDSDIKSLDMQKAISDMKQDGILEEYQYFVGSTNKAGKEPADTQKKELRRLAEDGIIIRK